MKILLTDSELEIHNISLLKEFNENEFQLEIESIPYIIKGKNLVLKEVYYNNQTIKITGNVSTISTTMATKEKKEKKSFIKRLLQ